MPNTCSGLNVYLPGWDARYGVCGLRSNLIGNCISTACTDLDLKAHTPHYCSMHGIFNLLKRFLARSRRQPTGASLSAIEYEAVSLIAYEGRERSDERGNKLTTAEEREAHKGQSFWDEVAAEVKRSIGAPARERKHHKV